MSCLDALPEDSVPEDRVIARNSRVPASFPVDRSHHIWHAIAGAVGPPGSDLAAGRYRADMQPGGTARI